MPCPKQMDHESAARSFFHAARDQEELHSGTNGRVERRKVSAKTYSYSTNFVAGPGHPWNLASFADHSWNGGPLGTLTGQKSRNLSLHYSCLGDIACQRFLTSRWGYDSGTTDEFVSEVYLVAAIFQATCPLVTIFNSVCSLVPFFNRLVQVFVVSFSNAVDGMSIYWVVRQALWQYLGSVRVLFLFESGSDFVTPQKKHEVGQCHFFLR